MVPLRREPVADETSADYSMNLSNDAECFNQFEGNQMLASNMSSRHIRQSNGILDDYPVSEETGKVIGD